MNFRSFFFLIAFLFNAHFLIAQYPIPSDTATLDVNNLVVKLINSGSFLDDRNGQIPFSVKTENGTMPLIGAAGLWLGGMDFAGTTKIATSLYNDGEKTDFYPGGVSDDGSLDSTISQNFNRFWSVTAEDIGLFVADYSDNGVIDNEIPYALKAWPASGNPFFENTNGFALPTSIIGAPFVDTNNDNQYNPMDGDYPCIAGDKAYWSIFNDAEAHTYSGAEDFIRMEVQSLVTAYHFPNTIFNNTVFFDFTFRNKAVESLDSIYVSLVTDAVLGCSSNNQFTCIPEEDIVIYYNAVPDNEFCDDSVSYEQNPGIIVIKTINAPLWDDGVQGNMQSLMYLRKESNEPIYPGMDWPTNAWEYRNYTKGLWRDQSPLTHGGDGYQEPGSFVTKYAFDGSGNPPWYDPEINTPVSIMSHFADRLNPQEVNRIVYAVSWLEGDFDITSEIDKQRIIDTMDQTFAYYVDGDYSVYPHFCHYDLLDNLTSPTLPSNVLVISPNPSIDEIKIDLQNSHHKIDELQLFNIEGRKISHWKTIDARSFIVPRNGLPTGMYVLAIKLTNGEEEIRKVVFE